MVDKSIPKILFVLIKKKQNIWPQISCSSKRRQKKFARGKTFRKIFWLRKSISGKFFIFRKCYFPERKMYSGVWLRTEFALRKWDSGVCFRNSFYGMRFTENHFQRLFPENIFRKMKFIFLQNIISQFFWVCAALPK